MTDQEYINLVSKHPNQIALIEQFPVSVQHYLINQDIKCLHKIRNVDASTLALAKSKATHVLFQFRKSVPDLRKEMKNRLEGHAYKIRWSRDDYPEVQISPTDHAALVIMTMLSPIRTVWMHNNMRICN